MAFRTIEISNPAEIHIKKHQLQIEQESGVAYIPIEDIANIFCIGPDIRLSTMDLSILSQNKVVVTTLDNKYLPTAIVTAYEGNARQSQLMHAQVNKPKGETLDLWCNITKRKIENQAKTLKLLSIPGDGKIMHYADTINSENVNYHESLAARDYFGFLFPGLNRRTDTPINSLT